MAYRKKKKDFLLWTITSTTTLFLGIEIGVLVGVSTLNGYMKKGGTNSYLLKNFEMFGNV